MSSSSFEGTVRDGMPVTVHYEVSPPEPAIGIHRSYVEDIWLEVKGKRAEWLEKRLTQSEWATLEAQAMENYYDK
jgi:hypothetical protein|tara:strand:- start:1420 stop:1644 length:225 start_codon:yes stop_codon:yes gene_type:complete